MALTARSVLHVQRYLQSQSLSPIRPFPPEVGLIFKVGQWLVLG